MTNDLPPHRGWWVSYDAKEVAAAAAVATYQGARPDGNTSGSKTMRKD